jgi:hypothetical protein
MMTDAEYEELVELGHAITAAESSRWQPGCIARAFATPPPSQLVLTMQGWIDLDLARSPLLDFKTPESAEQMQDAMNAFGLGDVKATDVEPAKAAALAVEMLDATRAAFSTGLKMTPPRTDAREPAELSNDGFGAWAPWLACLISQLGERRVDALAMPVAQAGVLIASMRRNQGWEVAGTPYALRDLGEPAPPEEAQP